VPAPIIGALYNFLQSELGVSVWDGEIPRYDVAGNPINPDATGGPSGWPVVRCVMPERAFKRKGTLGVGVYKDEGEIVVQVWGVARTETEPLQDQIEALFELETNWAAVVFNPAGLNYNPFRLWKMLLVNWDSLMLEGERTENSQLLYRAQLFYDCGIHGAAKCAASV
jgi:hypothetical protein